MQEYSTGLQHSTKRISMPFWSKKTKQAMSRKAITKLQKSERKFGWFYLLIIYEVKAQTTELTSLDPEVTKDIKRSPEPPLCWTTWSSLGVSFW